MIVWRFLAVRNLLFPSFILPQNKKELKEVAKAELAFHQCLPGEALSAFINTNPRMISAHKAMENSSSHPKSQGGFYFQLLKQRI